jgi:hypothetical protein
LTSDIIISKHDSQNSNEEGGALFFQRPRERPTQNPEKVTDIPSRVPTGARRNLSKSIIVHHNRKTNIIQSLGRYNDIMSHENFE